MPNWTKEQEEAIYKDNTSIIVSAGAGSGKTAVLSERVIRKIKDGCHVDELLILTFTKAAAAEMKERIRKKIKKEGLVEELDRIDSAYITTFDSYALSVVKKYNYLLNVSKNVSIIEPSIMLIKNSETLSKVFEELYEEKNSKFLKLIDDFCIKDDKDIKEYILNINSKLNMLYEKDDYLKNYIDNYFNDEYIENLKEKYIDLIKEKIGEINSLYIDLEEYVDGDYYEEFTNALGELIYAKNYGDIKSSIKPLPRLKKDSEEEVKTIKENISSLLKEITSLTEYTEEELKGSILSTKDYIEAIIEIINRFDDTIMKYKYDNDLFEFTDIAKMAIKVVEENESVRNEIKESLKEIMIDEYQDTSDLQELFISYIENNNVYMVGDIKQSIYRFRNANPNLFKEKYELYSEGEKGYKIDLNKNFRSREEVLSDINLIFNSIMDLKIGGADYKSAHQMIFGNASYNEKGKLNQDNNIELLTYNFDRETPYKKEEIEAFIIAYDIKEKIENNYKVFDKDTGVIRNMDYSDIVILMDRSTNFELYKKIFEYLNIPLTIYKDESITDNIDIYLIKNIINLMLLNENDTLYKYSFISIMRSYLFNMDDNLIFDYFLNNNFKESELIKKIKSIDYKSLTIEEIITNIIDEFDFYNKIITVGDIDKHIAVLDYIIDISKNLNTMGYTIYDFKDYLEEIIDKNYDINFSINSSQNGVKIMTIHKSKGLEYHLCYYTGMYASFNTSDLKEKFLYDNEYGIITPYINNGIKTIFYKELVKNKYLKDEISEKIRLFYVGLTRAKEKMIIVSPTLEDKSSGELKEIDKMKYKSFLDIITSVKNDLSSYTNLVDIEKLNISKEYNMVKKTNYQENIKLIDEKIKTINISFPQVYVDNKHFSKENLKIIDEKVYKNIEFGKKIHSIFENIEFKNPDYSNLSNFEKEKIEALIKTNILDGAINIFKEYEFIYEDIDEYHGIIDLLIETKDEFKIVDYKLKNTDDEAYLNQLSGYKKYIESITNKPVKTYLYSIIDENLKEI